MIDRYRYSPHLAATLSYFPDIAGHQLEALDYFTETGHTAPFVGTFEYEQEVALPIRRVAKVIGLVATYRDTSNTLPHYLDEEAAVDIMLAVTPVKKEDQRETALHIIRKALTILDLTEWELQEMKEYVANLHQAEASESYAQIYLNMAAGFRGLNIKMVQESKARRKRLQKS